MSIIMIRICLHMQANTHTRTHTQTHARAHTRAHTQTHTHIRTHTHTYTHTHAHTYTHTRARAHTHTHHSLIHCSYCHRYQSDSHELQARHLADISMLLHNYDYAYQLYHTLKGDFKSDRAWLHYAGAMVRNYEWMKG